ncbi:SUKH-4 family immunity protein [Streptomyces sp. T-3]|nr:SUKH-4 family immunity protein [Streptomyces sp. T-3]
MTTQEQAFATADRWLNGDAPAGQRREVLMQEFSLGWVVWAAPPPMEVDPVTGARRPPAEFGGASGVVDRRTGELSTWPSVPVEEVIRMYEDKHGTPVQQAQTPPPPPPSQGGVPQAPQISNDDPAMQAALAFAQQFAQNPDAALAQAAAGPAASTGEQPPVTGPGNTAVFTYVNPANGEETSLFKNSAPGVPQAEIQAYHELMRMNVPPQNVVGVHTDLRPALLPGGYTGEFLLSGALPTAQFSCTQEYGMLEQEREQGVAALIQHVEMIHSIGGQQPPPRPHRSPLPAQITPARQITDADLGLHLDKLFGEEEGGSGVRRFAPQELAMHPLPPAAVQTLTVAGLPADVPFFFGAARPGHPVMDAASHLRHQGTQIPEAQLATLAGHVRIGTDGWAEITVQCAGSPEWQGLVWAASPKSGSGRLVNTSVAAFVRSLALLVATRGGMVGMDPHQAGAAVKQFQERLVAIDARALERDNWWATIVDQMWHGLF